MDVLLSDQKDNYKKLDIFNQKINNKFIILMNIFNNLIKIKLKFITNKINIINVNNKIKITFNVIII